MKKHLIIILLVLFILSCTNFTFDNNHDPRSEKCLPPVNFTASAGIFNHIKLNWEKMDYTDEYVEYYTIIRRCEGEENKLYTIADKNRTLYEDYDVWANKTYYYKISAKLNTGVVTDWSPEMKGHRSQPDPRIIVRIQKGNGDEYIYDDVSFKFNEETTPGRILGFKIDMDNAWPGIQLEYIGHFAYKGNAETVNDGQFLEGGVHDYHLEQFKIKIKPEIASRYNICYKAYLEIPPISSLVLQKTSGWTEKITKNGTECGITGMHVKIKSLKVWIEEKK